MADRIKLVACDIDGTLLFDWNPDGIEQRVFDAIEALASRDVGFMAASGRQYANLRRLFAPVADRIVYLCENGTLVVEGGETLAIQPMDLDLAFEIFEAVLEHPGCDPMISGVDTGYALASNAGFIDHLRNVVGNNVTPINRLEEIQGQVIKVCFHAEHDLLEAVTAEFHERFDGRANVVTSGAYWMDIAPLGADKGTAIEAYGKLKGIEPPIVNSAHLTATYRTVQNALQ